MNHDKFFTTVAIIKILKELLKKYPLDTINLFSDGASQHFKQKFFFNAVTLLPNFLGLDGENTKIFYDFFATSHGKGAVNGIGGSIKRGVMAQVTNRRELIKSAKDFATTARKVCPGINVIFLKKSEVEHNIHLLNQVAFSGVRTLNGIRKVHHMEVSNVTTLGLLHFFKFLLDHFLIKINSDSLS